MYQSESHYRRIMTISFIRARFLILLLVPWCSSHAQENYVAYFQPQLALNYEVSRNYSHNFSLSSRNFIFQDRELEFRGRNLDLSHFSTLKMGLNSSLGGGIMYRFRQVFETNRDNEVRFTQQYNLTTRPLVVRYGHRLRTEQRIFPNITVHRFRYRFTLDFPLEGEKVDVNEVYLIINTEALLSIGNGRIPQYDQRVAVNLGWLLSPKVQLQAGIENRWENYRDQTQMVLFLNSSLILSL